ncbi:MAG: glycerol-3-phosphate dehydrogenase/oxidase [Planctomycetota bacterium]
MGIPDRATMLDRVRGAAEPWDMLVIGGGATGVGVALDAAARGYRTLLLEQHDLGKGTSSRSTKLVHGGVRYLQQGNVSLVMEALRERGILHENAPHLVDELRFIVPNYSWWEAPFYCIGMKVYDLLARKYSFGPSRNLDKDETLSAIPTLQTDGLRGGVQYFDGQFDDARLLVNMAQTAIEQGATVLNHCPVTGLTRGDDGFIDGATARDAETGEAFQIKAKVVVNATGAFCDAVRRMADDDAEPMIAPSQGVHLVFDKKFLPGDTAIMVPHTSDGRVMFAIPWHGKTVVGTTDTPIESVDLEPKALDEEIGFILETAGLYLEPKPTREDVLSVFCGIRPLVKASGEGNTSKLSRDHTIHISQAGLLTIAGGKWTTYRHMAEDAVNQAAVLGDLEDRACTTRTLRIHGHCDAEAAPDLGIPGDLAVYGSDAPRLRELIEADPALGEPLHAELPYPRAVVVWAARHELARGVDDVLARRTRALLLNARAAIAAALVVAELLAMELNRDEAWQREQVDAFRELAAAYLPQ